MTEKAASMFSILAKPITAPLTRQSLDPQFARVPWNTKLGPVREAEAEAEGTAQVREWKDEGQFLFLM